MLSQTVITEATLEDIPLIILICEEYHREASMWNKKPFNDVKVKDELSFAITSPTQFIAVASRDVGHVGFIMASLSSVAWDDTLLCTERFLYVLKEYRNYWIAKRLEEAKTNWAKREGATLSWVGSNSGIRNATRFYERLGYVVGGHNLFKEV